MEQRNEPTTGEIVRALRCVAEATECKDCRYKYPVGNVIRCDHEQMNGNAADRLESQERTIAALTARAESAEKLAAAAIADIERLRLKNFTLCPICEFEDMIGCAHKNHCTGYQKFTWRGLQPQEVEP